MNFKQTVKFNLQYDTVDLRVLKSWQNKQLNLAHRTETKKIKLHSCMTIICYLQCFDKTASESGLQEWFFQLATNEQFLKTRPNVE